MWVSLSKLGGCDRFPCGCCKKRECYESQFLRVLYEMKGSMRASCEGVVGKKYGCHKKGR